MLCVSFEMMGFCEGIGGKLYSRRLTPCGRGLMAPPGLRPWAPKVPPVIGFALQAGSGLSPRVVMKYRCAGEVRRPFGRHFLCRLWRRKPDNRASPVKKPYNRPGGRVRFPLWWLAPHLARWEACHWILSRLRLPANPVPLPPQAGAQQPVLTVEPLMKRVFLGVLFCPLNRGKSGAAG